MPTLITINGIKHEINERTLNLLSKEELCRITDTPCDAKHKKTEALNTLLGMLSQNPTSLEFIYKSHQELFGLSPYFLEETIGCTSNERKKWTKDGRLHVVGSTPFNKYGKTLEAPLYDRWQAEFVITDEVLEKWRTSDAQATKENRKAGAAKAVKTAQETRRKNTKARKRFAFKYNELVSEWNAYGKKEAALLELAYWTMWQNRWAKTDQMKSAGARKNKNKLEQASKTHYSNKEKALKLIVQSGMGEIAFYRPENADKIRIHFCDAHYDEIWEYFHYGYRASEIFRNNPSKYRSCPYCMLEEQRDYYSLYYIAINIGDYKFSFHTPYDIGKRYLPETKDLPLVQHQEQEGMFRFGRGLTEDEIITHTEKLSDEMFQKAFEQYTACCQY